MYQDHKSRHKQRMRNTPQFFNKPNKSAKSDTIRKEKLIESKAKLKRGIQLVNDGAFHRWFGDSNGVIVHIYSTI